MPKVSVLMSCYKSNPEYLKEAINSVLNQTYSDFELLIANNNDIADSIYKVTEDTVKQFQELDGRIIYVNNNGNLGGCASMNNLIKLAKGEFITICDHDDIYEQSKLQIQLDTFSKPENVDIDVVSGGVEMFWDNGRKTHVCHPMQATQITANLVFWQPVMNPTYMVKKASILKCGCWLKQDEYKIATDFEMWSRNYFLKHLIIPSTLVKYRKHSNSDSTINKTQLRVEHQRIVRRNLLSGYGICIDNVKILRALDPFSHVSSLNKTELEYLKKLVEVLPEEEQRALRNILVKKNLL